MYILNSLGNSVHNYFPTSLRAIGEGVSSAAVNVFKYLALVGLYAANPTLFAIGFVAGIAYEDPLSRKVDAVAAVVMQQKFKMGCCITVACLLSLPVVVATSSILAATYFGGEVSRQTRPIVPVVVIA